MHPDFTSSRRFHLGPGPTCLRFASLQTGGDADDSPGETSVGPASVSSRPPSSGTRRTSARYPITSFKCLFDCGRESVSAQDKVGPGEESLPGCCRQQGKNKKGNRKTSGVEHLRVTA